MASLPRAFPCTALPVLCLFTGGSLFQDLREAPRRTAPANPASPTPAPVQTGGTLREWDLRRAKLLTDWGKIIGPFPRRVPLHERVLSSTETATHTRILMEYSIDERTREEAYVLRPKSRAGPPRPGVVVLHQTAARNADEAIGLSGRENIQFGIHLVERGYIVVAPRNYLWSRAGESYQAAADRQIGPGGGWKTGMARMTWDAIRSTDLLCGLPGVDTRRIGSIGHSLGGKEVLYHAAFDPRIRAAISCEGGIGLRFSNWDADWYLGRQIRSPEFGRDHHELLATIAPRAFLLIGGESADGAQSWPFIQAAIPAWQVAGAEERLGLYRHRFGHNFVPPGDERERIYGWLETWLNEPRPVD